jgi:hypothetical protein
MAISGFHCGFWGGDSDKEIVGLLEIDSSPNKAPGPGFSNALKSDFLASERKFPFDNVRDL